MLRILTYLMIYFERRFFYLKRREISFEFDSVIASSILSFAVSLFGNTNVRLQVWWHYLLAVMVLLIMFLLFFVGIEIVVNVWKKHFQRANITAEKNKEIRELENYIKILYDKHLNYQDSQMDEYKEVLIGEMSAVYLKSIKKIELIKRFSSSQTLRNKFTTIDIGLMETYVQFCNRIKEIYNF